MPFLRPLLHELLKPGTSSSGLVFSPTMAAYACTRQNVTSGTSFLLKLPVDFQVPSLGHTACALLSDYAGLYQRNPVGLVRP
jgi:hypothetical protein